MTQSKRTFIFYPFLKSKMYTNKPVLRHLTINISNNAYTNY